MCTIDMNMRREVNGYEERIEFMVIVTFTYRGVSYSIKVLSKPFNVISR